MTYKYGCYPFFSLSRDRPNDTNRVYRLTSGMDDERRIVRLYLAAIKQQLVSLGQKISSLFIVLEEAGGDDVYHPEFFIRAPEELCDCDHGELLYKFTKGCHEYQEQLEQDKAEAVRWLELAEIEANEIAQETKETKIELQLEYETRSVFGLEAHAEHTIRKCRQIQRNCNASLSITIRRLEALIADGIVHDGIFVPYNYKEETFRTIVEGLKQLAAKRLDEISLLEEEKQRFFTRFRLVHDEYFEQ